MKIKPAKYLFILSIIFYTNTAFSQTVTNCEFLNVYGTTNNDHNRQVYFDETSKTGLVCGLTNNKGSFANFDLIGNIYNLHSYNSISEIWDIVPIDNSSDLILLSKTSSTLKLYRVQDSGVIVWAKEYSLGTIRNPDICKGLNNEFYIAAWTASIGISDDVLVFKINEQGTILWSKKFDDVDDQMTDIACDRAGNLILVGGLHSSPVHNFLMKMDASGSVSIKKRNVSNLSSYAQGQSLYINVSNEIFVGGYASINSSSDVVVTKYDKDLNVLWSTYISLPGPNHAYSIIQTNSRNIFTASFITKTNNDIVAAISKLDANGNHLWTKALPKNKYTTLNSYSTPLSEQLILSGSVLNHPNGIGAIDASLSFQDTSLSGCLDSLIMPVSGLHSWQEFEWLPTETSVTVSVTNLSDVLLSPTISTNTLCDTCLTLVAPPINTSTWIVDNDTICLGDSTRTETNFEPTHTYQWLRYGVPITGATNYYYYVKKSGNYKVRITNAFGAFGTSGKIKITRLAPPLASVSALGSTLICAGSTVTLQANMVNGYTYQWYKSGNPIPNAFNQTYDAFKSGKHKVLITDIFGCQNYSNKIAITKLPNPSVNINLTGTVTICQGSAITLTALPTGGTAPYSFQWKRYGVPISGATLQSVIVSQNGGYKVFITDANNCQNKTQNATKIKMIPCPVKAYHENITVYPNPADEIATINFSIHQKELITISLFDILGNEIISINNEVLDEGHHTIEFNVSKFAPGIYFVYAATKSIKFYEKIIVE